MVTLIASKTIALHPTLSAAAKSVGVGLIEHYNRQSGRCFPAIERLASLLDMNRTTVIRSIATLCKLGMFAKVRVRGRSSAIQYQPNWKQLIALHDDWCDRIGMKRWSPVAEAPLAQSQTCPEGGGLGATLTCLNNLQKKPIARGSSGNLAWQSKASLSKGLGKDGASGQRLASIEGRESVSREMAQDRWRRQLRLAFVNHPMDLEKILEEVTDEVAANATSAELAERGGGVRYMLNLIAQGQRAREARGSSQAPHPVAVDSNPDNTPVTQSESWVDDG
jgi:hypothetical protein